MTTLTADELTTLGEVLGHEPPYGLVTWVEETITAHRDEATAMADLTVTKCSQHQTLSPEHLRMLIEDRPFNITILGDDS